MLNKSPPHFLTLSRSARLGVHQTKKELRNRFKQEEIFIPSNLVNTTALFRGKRNYELSNHLGNVQMVISDKRKSVCDEELGVEYFVAEVLSAVDYYPFGKILPDRQWYYSNDTSGYRFAFNGKEIDREHGGAGNTYDYGFRIYNPDYGKFLSVDPLFKSYPWYTPYQFAGNKPIWAIDLDGLEPISINGVVTEYEIVHINKTPESALNDMSLFVNKKTGESFTFDHAGISSQYQFGLINGKSKAIDMKTAAETMKSAAYSGFAIAVVREQKGITEKQYDMTPEERDEFINAVNQMASGALGKTFRHYALQAYFTVRWSSNDAKNFGDFYERNQPNPDTRDFDLINNERGRKIGKELGGKYNLTCAEGVAGFLNEIVDIVRKEEGLDPLPEGKKVFSAGDSFVKNLVIATE